MEVEGVKEILNNYRRNVMSWTEKSENFTTLQRRESSIRGEKF